MKKYVIDVTVPDAGDFPDVGFHSAGFESAVAARQAFALEHGLTLERKISFEEDETVRLVFGMPQKFNTAALMREQTNHNFGDATVGSYGEAFADTNFDVYIHDSSEEAMSTKAQFEAMTPEQHVAMKERLKQMALASSPRPSDDTLEGYALSQYTKTTA